MNQGYSTIFAFEYTFKLQHCQENYSIFSSIFFILFSTYLFFTGLGLVDNLTKEVDLINDLSLDNQLRDIDEELLEIERQLNALKEEEEEEEKPQISQSQPNEERKQIHEQDYYYYSDSIREMEMNQLTENFSISNLPPIVIVKPNQISCDTSLGFLFFFVFFFLFIHSFISYNLFISYFY